MATPLEEQDKKYKEMGFFLDKDYSNSDPTLKDMINFITRDGGEVREGTAYEEDGTTTKKGATRLYYK